MIRQCRARRCRGGKSVGRNESDIDARVIEQEPEIAGASIPKHGHDTEGLVLLE
jgi:hypothetical protein